jgi:membrane protein
MIEESRNLKKRITQFLLHDVWETEISSLSAMRALLVRIVRVGHMVIKGFGEDELPVRASSLTYTALMSLVPLCAIVFAILNALGFGEDRITALLKWTEDMPEQFQSFIVQLRELANATNFAALGWIGVVFLLLTAVMVLANIELSFNRVWGITHSRNLLRRVANYISILVVVPILVGAATTITATLRSDAMIARLGSIGFIYHNLLNFLPLISTWLAFGFLYASLPNTRVKANSAIISGLVGAILWLIWQKVYIALQLGVARYNQIYGAFAVIPIFLAWLYISWVIILLGAEVAFAVQNEATYHLERDAESANLKARTAIGLAVMERAAEALEEQAPPMEISTFARERKIPVRLLNEVTELLVCSGWLAEVSERSGQYVLLKAPEKIHIKEIFARMLDEGMSSKHLGVDHLGAPVEQVLSRLEQGLDKALDDLTLRDMVDSAA